MCFEMPVSLFNAHAVIRADSYQCHQREYEPASIIVSVSVILSVRKQLGEIGSTFATFPAILLVLCPSQWIQECFHRKTWLQKKKSELN